MDRRRTCAGGCQGDGVVVIGFRGIAKVVNTIHAVEGIG